jgi:hypothetical protein
LAALSEASSAAAESVEDALGVEVDFDELDRPVDEPARVDDGSRPHQRPMYASRVSATDTARGRAQLLRHDEIETVISR